MLKDGFFRYIAVVLTVAVFMTSIACGPSQQKSIGQFEMVSLIVMPSEVSIGEGAEVTAKIVNIGEAQGTYTAVLMIDGVEFERKNVVIPAQSSAVVTFSAVKNETGVYQLAIDDLTANLSVSDPMQAIRSAWESFEPLADAGLVRFELLFNRRLYDTGALTEEKYLERRNTLQAEMMVFLKETENQPLIQEWLTGTDMQYSSLYIDSLETAMNELRSNLGIGPKSTMHQELQAAWESLEPLGEIELMMEKNLLDSWLKEAGSITPSELGSRNTMFGENADAALDKIGNEDLAKKFAKAALEPLGAKKFQLWTEFMNLYEKLFREAMDDFSNKLGQE